MHSVVRTAEKSHTVHVHLCRASKRDERQVHAGHCGIDSGEVYASKSCASFNIMQIRGEKHQIAVRMNAVASFKNISISADLHSLEFLVGSRT